MKMTMHMPSPRPVVHLELHTGDQARASVFYAELLCWRRQLIEAGGGSYLTLDLGGGFGGGIVECGTARPLWLPYVEVGQIKSPPNTRASSAPRCCWRRARGRPDGAVSFRRRSAVSWLSGSQNDDGRA